MEEGKAQSARDLIVLELYREGVESSEELRRELGASESL